ncbi:translocation/assembly module TamB domain-containing protein [Ruegeria profundi]|uniref:translocation/assembly module TamB domain-containing protein n=1 Tax=Ruegeria profundi TaxID=1685378 RepID=UPI001CD5C93C|nr:translocation/assembly module TamB domain-containing protein [Ruegeria profundi]MCA0927805.1 translocation/assembly module TamB domain-containing protein [Ruegeria profundi]
MIRQYSYPVVTTVLILTAPPVFAQQDDGGGSMLERFLQDTLSGDDQNVTVKGLQGALSARATIEEITVSDDEGVWLTIKQAELDWNRLALIRGRFSVNALTAQEIDIARAPGTTTKDTPEPAAETQPFELPELPVSVEIGEIRINELLLGEPLIGVAAALSVTGNLSLADGTLDTNLDITRLDRAGDRVTLTAGFQNASREINLDLDVSEAEGGVISTALKIPDSPAIGFTAKGAGPLTDFTADIALSSDRQPRVTGQVQLRAAETGAADGIAFTADLGGDLTPFMAEDLDPFFGPNTRVFVNGQTKPQGALDLPDIELTTQALDLKGELQLAEGGTLEMVALQGRITPPDGETVVLPVSGGDTSIEAAQISALFDRANGNLWDLSLTADAFQSPQASLRDAAITAQGTLEQGDAFSIQGDLQAIVDGVDLNDQAINTALGDRLTLDGQFDYGSDQTLNLSGFELVGTDYTLALDALIDGLDTGLTVDGSAVLNATDLARFSDLAQLDLGGQASARIDGNGSTLEGSFDGKLTVEGRNLVTGRDDIDPIIKGETTITVDGSRGSGGITIREFALNSAAAQAQANGDITTPNGNLTIDGQASVTASDLSVFSGLAKRDLGGALQAKVVGKGAVQTLEFDGTASVTGQDIKTGMSEIDPLLAGKTVINWDGAYSGDRIEIREATVNGAALTAQVAATVDDPTSNLAIDGNARINAPDLSLFSGLAKRDLGGSIAANIQGNAAIANGIFDIQGEVNADDIRTGIEMVDTLIQGRTTLNIDAANGEQGVDIRTFRLTGTALTATASGQLDREAGGLSFNARLDDLARVNTLVSGPLTLDGNVAPTPSGLEGTTRLTGPDSSYAELTGTVDSDGSADLDFDAKLNRIERFAPEFPGTVAAIGNAKRNGGVWTIDGSANGPAEISSTIKGTFDETSGEADLEAQGGINLGVANLFISPNKIEGTARHNLRLRGKPGLGALSGSITTSGTSLALPGIGQTVTGISGSVELAESRATISLSGGMRAGGNFTVSGPLDLTPPLNANIVTRLNNLVLTDKLLYETTLNGEIAMTGTLAGNSALTGQITFEETNINLAAASGAVGAAPIPEIEHLDESQPVFITRERAGLVVEEGQTKSESRIALDISLLAPKAVFVRGRGVNAELGGRLFIGGTTTSIIPSGQIELIRGNFDILGRRLALTKGLVTLQGDLKPYIEFASSTSTSDGTATIEIAGPLDSPKVDVFSDPERPAEEALAMLLFGNRFSEISPFVIAQMAASLAQLSGAVGDTTKGLREAAGVDTVDIGASEGGTGRLGAGAYLSDNLYTDFTVNTEGDTEVNLNLDVTDSFTVRGTVDGRGETGLGVFFERDY